MIGTIFFPLFGLFVSIASGQNVHQQFKGCFQFKLGQRDLEHREYGSEALGSIQGCVQACQTGYFMYAGIHNGDECYCGASYGRFGPGSCKTRCAKNPNESCGGPEGIAIFETDVKVPGPPTDLTLTSRQMTSLDVKWKRPDVPEDFLTDFYVYANQIRSFDSLNRRFAPKEYQLSPGVLSTRVVGLQPGTLYNVSVVAASKDGLGPVTSIEVWTEIGVPSKPTTPQLIRHAHSDDSDSAHDSGELHLALKPLENNKNGPITGYRIVVINETEPAPFNPDFLADWPTSQSEGLKYWIAAELNPDWFDSNQEFVVGDGRYYGDYLNYGPLPGEYDFHVTVGVVSTFGNVTKVSYADVSHNQHAKENIFVFKFHALGEGHDDEDHHKHDHDHDDNHEVVDGDDHHRDPVGSRDGVVFGLSVLIVIFGILLVGVIILYLALRFCIKDFNFRGVRGRGRGSHGDVQELTAQQQLSAAELEAGYAHSEQYAYANDALSGETASTTADLDMEALREKVWQIPRNFLELSGKVLGRGKFGSVIQGKVNKRGTEAAAIIQVVRGTSMTDSEMSAMIRDIEIVARYGLHANVLQLIGICEEREALYIVLEEGESTLKKTLLDSRALVHNPGFARRHQRVSTLTPEQVVDIIQGVARGMEYLGLQQIYHKKLCARNVFLVGDTPKITGIGITEYTQPGQDLDLTRWMAMETFKSRSYHSKCDIWSFGVLIWEITTLGGTPYPEVKVKDLPTRLGRGLRLNQPPFVSDDLYQLMLECWQNDLDERPTFEQINDALNDLQTDCQAHINFSSTEGIVMDYPHFSNDLELIN